MLNRRQDFILSALDVLARVTEDLNEADKNSYAARLSALRTRFHDPEFRLAIVGNFNCGKSTFLNALLKKKLLTTALLPTTAIPTYLRWDKNHTGTDPRIALTMTDGKFYSLTPKEKNFFERATGLCLPDTLGAIIDTLTTTNSLIGKIGRVDLTFPARDGFENFCLIDTPGLNPGAEESKLHILQTQTVLRQDADAVILLYPATKTMTRNTENFMRDNAEHLMEGATIILTQIDLVPAAQIAKIVKYTAQLVKNRFNQVAPKVYTLSAQQALEYFSGTGTDKEAAEKFDGTLNEIIGQLRENREEIISRRITELIGELIGSISKAVTSDMKELEEKRAALQKASAENLEEDFGKLADAYEKFFTRNTGCYLQRMNEIVRTHISVRREKIFRKLEAADTVEETVACLKIFYPQTMTNIGEEILEQLDAQIARPINRSSQAYAEKLTEYLHRYERYLGKVSAQAVSVQSEQFLATASVVPVFEDTFADKISSAVNLLRNNFEAAQVGESLAGALNAAEGWLDEKVFSDERAAKIKEGVTRNWNGAKSWLEAKFSLSERTTRAKEFLGRNLHEAGEQIAKQILARRKATAKDLVARNLSEHETKLIADCTQSIKQIIFENLSWARNLLGEYKAGYRSAFESVERKHNERVAEVEEQIIRHKENRRRIEELKEQSEEL